MLGSQLLLDAPAGCSAVGTDLRAAPEGAPQVGAVGADLCDAEAVARLFREHGPFDAVIHAAAFTAVDLAEEQRELALRVNGAACGVLARECAARGARLVLVSTDFVFDGEARRPYREGDATRPLSVYGSSKLAGEEAALGAHPRGTLVARTQWLYGPRGKHFPGTILRAAREKGALRVVDDQRGSPTSTLELAPALWELARHGEPGIYHAACEGDASWYEFARACLELAGPPGVRIDPCSTSDYPRPAHRPAYSVLDCSKLAALRGRRLASWRAALERFFALEKTLA